MTRKCDPKAQDALNRDESFAEVTCQGQHAHAVILHEVFQILEEAESVCFVYASAPLVVWASL